MQPADFTPAGLLGEAIELRKLLHDEDTKVSLVDTVKKVVARSHERARYLRVLMRASMRVSVEPTVDSKHAFTMTLEKIGTLQRELDELREAAARKVNETDAEIGGRRALARFVARVNECCDVNALAMQIDPNESVDVMASNLAGFFANERNATLALHTRLGEARKEAARAKRLLEDTRDADVVKMREERDAALAARDAAQTQLAQVQEELRGAKRAFDRLASDAAARHYIEKEAKKFLTVLDPHPISKAAVAPETFTGLHSRYAEQVVEDVMQLAGQWNSAVKDYQAKILSTPLSETCVRGNKCHDAYHALQARVRELARLAYPVKSDAVLPVQKAARDVLQEAQAIVDGARRKDYGHPAENHARTAQLFSTYLGHAVTAEQVCMLNILQKVSRFVHGGSRDNLVDIAGYARNVELIREKAGTPTQGAD